MTFVCGSVVVECFLDLDDEEAEMDRWTIRWLEDPSGCPLFPPLAETAVAPCAEWLDVPLLCIPPPPAAPEAAALAFCGREVRKDKDDPDRLPSLSAYFLEKQR